MKKTLIIGLAALAALGFTACNCNGKADSTCDKTAKCSKADKEVLYSGILPAADAQGTVYTLKLEFDSEHNGTEGDYALVETTLASDTTVVSGLKEVATSYTKGDFRKESKQVEGATVDYIRLIPDAEDALGDASASSLYFLVNEDESLTMVNASLEKSVSPELNYTLTVVK